MDYVSDAFVDPSTIPPGVLTARRRALEEAAELAVLREYGLAWQCFHRLRRLSTNHAAEAWRTRYHRPLAAYALAYLFAQPEAESGARVDAVRAATRAWWAGAESTHLLPLLAAVTNVVRDREPGTAWELRDHIANKSDPGMAREARYVGLGISILHTATGTFEQACQSADNEWDIPGTIVYLSAAKPEFGKQRAYIADRRGRSDLGQITIHNHEALTRLNRSSPYPFSEETLDTLYRQFGHGHTLNAMWRLDRELRDADAVRRDLQEQERVRHEEELARHEQERALQQAQELSQQQRALQARHALQEQERARQAECELPQAWLEQHPDTDRQTTGGGTRRRRWRW